MSEYGVDCSDNDYKEYKCNEEIEEEIDKELAIEKEFTNDSYSQDLDSKEYDPFTIPDLTLKDDGSKEYDPFTPPDLTLSDDSKEYDPFTPPDLTLSDDSKEYDPFTPPDLTLKGESSNKEINEEIIKENEPEFIQERTIDHNITFDHIYEKDLEDIVKDIDQAEKVHAIYAEDIMIPNGDKEAVEQYYMEQMKAEGVIITNELYFEETSDKKQATLDHFNEHTTDSIDDEKEQLNKELDPTTKANFTEIDGKDISIAKDIEYENEAHKSAEVSKEINEQQEDIQIQEGISSELSKSEVKELDKAKEIPRKYSSGQQATQVLRQDIEEIKDQKPQEIIEEDFNDTEEIRQNEVKETLIPEVKNEVDKKKLAQDQEKEPINSSSKEKESEITAKKSEFDHKIIEQEAEIKEDKQEKIDIEIDLKEEWEKELIEWIKEVKDEDLSPEKKEELIEYMRKYRDAREEHKKLHYLNLHLKQNDISEEEKRERTYLKEKIKEYDEIDVEMFKEFHAYRRFYEYNKRRWYDTVNRSKKQRYPKLVAQKLQRLKDKRIKKTQDYQEQILGELSKEISKENYELLNKRYHQETGRNAIYGKKETKGFKKWKKDFNEAHLNEEISESSHEIKGEWADVLKRHIHDISDEKISQEIKEEMIYVIDNFNNLQKSSINLPPNLRQIIEELRQFQTTYDEYKERSYNKSIPREVSRVAKKLKKKLEEIKREAILGIILGGDKKELQNFTEILSENLYKSKMSLNEKSKINKIIHKKKLAQKDKEELLSILNNLSGEELNSLLRDNFKNITQNRLESELTKNKEKINERIEKGLKFDQKIEKSLFSFGESLDYAIIGIYYICEIFSKINNLEKPFFTGNELNQILGKTHNFFKNLRKKLLDKNVIQYYGTSSRKKNSFEKGYTITKKGLGFATEIIELKKQKFPNLFRKLILIFELRYKEYNKELMSSNKSMRVHSQKDINSELIKLAEENKVEMLTPYKSKESEIHFQCKVCKKKFIDIYYNIKRRQQPRIICPICFPDLKPNIYTSMELIEKISVYAFNELSKAKFHKLSDIEGESMKRISIIKEIVYNQIEPQISEKNLDFKEHIDKYVFAIVHFLARVKLLSETNQRLNISEVAKETHDKELITDSHWQNITLKIIQYLRKNLKFKIRTKKHESKSLSSQKSIRSYKNLFKLINNITITYFNLDFKTKIEVFYDGKCEGIDGICPFGINYKYLPALSHHHNLKGYKKKIKRKEFKYIKPKDFLNYSFAKAIELMETQIGGLGVQCKNCHSLKHAVRYNFPIIFKFLRGISIRGINKNPTEVLITVSRIVNEYYEQNKKNFRISQKYPLSIIKSNIKRAILRFIRKKYIIEYLFGVNYVCPICGEANINDHLNCFVAHHTNEELFENGFEKIDFGQEYDRSIEWLIKNIIIQECIYICDNCHSMLHATNYRDSVLTILEDQKESKFIEDYYYFLDDKVKEKRDMILEKKEKLMKNNLKFPNPLQSIFEKGETLDKNLLCIYYITEIFSRETKKQFFTADEFNYVLKKFYRYFQAYKNELINYGYIQYIERLKKYQGSRFNKDIYHITSKGIEKAKEIIILKLEKFPEEFKELIHTWRTLYIKYKNSTMEKEKAK